MSAQSLEAVARGMVAPGRGILAAPTVLAGVEGVTAISQLDNEPD